MVISKEVEVSSSYYIYWLVLVNIRLRQTMALSSICSGCSICSIELKIRAF